ncbi:glycoside hydrolase family 17 protein [Aulographum hederae CBS 113979]|uniref:glucan endo-1,3-beta-D-glucosidase n=1 Tax=Aulographum hederae CBS 113979 TaxID=1176131 RepID=A0A6G1H6U2_9PEZI|nr:glycoside hydrolase family 17 protein [Aulographum hederae CBS 113979]
MSSQPPHYGGYGGHDDDYSYCAPHQNMESPHQDFYTPPAQPPAHRAHPAAHPDSNFQRQRQHPAAPPPVTPLTSSLSRRPIPRPSLQQAPQQQPYNTGPHSNESITTPGMDNMGATAGGGIAGVAMSVAGTHERESGAQAIRDIDNLYSAPGPWESHDEREYGYDNYDRRGGRDVPSQASYYSTVPIAAAGLQPGSQNLTPRPSPSNTSFRENTLSPDPNMSHRSSWYENPFDNHSISGRDPRAMNIGTINPMEIADDNEDPYGLPAHNNGRKSILPIHRRRHGNGDEVNSSKSSLTPAAGAVIPPAAGAAAGGVLGSLHRRDPSGSYGPIPSSASKAAAAPAVYPMEAEAEKPSDWLVQQKSGNKRLRWIVGCIIAFIVLAAIAGGIAGGILGSRAANKDKDASKGESAAQDDGRGDLDKDSAEIKKLLNNPNLHKVFPGMDYTPLNAQYPDCMHNPPSQNNVTRDMAMLSQLTSAIRLYGTDCNQTEMVLHSIDRLGIKSDMKVWLGVWLGNNETTNDRQLRDMWSILRKHGADPFKGVVVGNEVLFREDLTSDELGTILADVKSNLTDMNIDLPLATSDLGDNWTPTLASEVDVVMSNIHPFFGGVEVDQAADWTWSFWQNNDIPKTQGMTGKTHVISEVGWPSAGGNDCAPKDVCPDKTSGSVAGIPEMNQFMDDWVCQSLANGTDYFWFEAFDEPWKEQFNEPSKGKEWEDKWGLMDVNRNLKPGIKIPDCGGRGV